MSTVGAVTFPNMGDDSKQNGNTPIVGDRHN